MANCGESCLQRIAPEWVFSGEHLEENYPKCEHVSARIEILGFKNLARIRVIDGCRSSGFLEDLLSLQIAARGSQKLQSYTPAQSCIFGNVYLTETALADFLNDPIVLNGFTHRRRPEKP